MAIVHNVQVHPIYSGHINDHKVLAEREFDTAKEATDYVKFFNNSGAHGVVAAIYNGAIDTETGENL